MRAWVGQRLSWRLGGYTAVGLAVGGLYLWRLGSLTPGLAPDEAQATAASRSLEAIWLQPLNAPHKLLQHGLSLISNSAFSWRLASVILALIFLACFVWLVRASLGVRAALFGLLMLGLTPWLVLIGRSAAAPIDWLWPLAVTAAALWWWRTRRWQTLAGYLTFLSLGLALYVPGLAWFLVIGIIIARRQLAELWRRGGWLKNSLGLLLLIGVVAPLAKSLVADQVSLSDWLALPRYWPSPLEFIRAVGRALTAIAWHTPGNLNWVIDHLAIFSSAQLVLAFIGLASLWLRGRGRYGLYLLTWVGLAVVLAGLNRDLAVLTVALPVVSGLAAAGLYYLWAEWRRGFPRNPLARSLAAGLIGLILVWQFVFAARYCLVAWPHAPATRASYVLQ